jgi:DNA-binding transcriptional ArsR family regulator
VLNIETVAKAKTKKVQPEPKARMDAYEAVFTALAHPARRRILLTLNFEGGSMTAGQIADMFEQAWPTTTRHLQVLETAGLLHQERQGRHRVYRIDRQRLELVRDWLAWFFKDPC